MATYKELITQVINNLDAIYGTLRSKGAVYNAPATGDTGIAVSEYSGLINDHLFKIEEVSTGTIVKPTGGIIKNFTGNQSSKDFGSATISYANSTIAITGLKEGFYNATSVLGYDISELIETKDASNLEDVTNENVVTGYKVSVSEGKLLKQVNLAKAAIAVEGKIASKDASSAPKVSMGISSTTSDGLVVSEAAIDDGYALTVTYTGTVSGTLVTNLSENTTFTAGYIKSASDLALTNPEYSLAGVSGESTKSYWLKKGSFGLKSVTASGSIDVKGLLTGNATTGYEVSASIDKPTILGTATTGYVVSDGNDVDLSPQTWDGTVESVYIKKGKVENLTVTPVVSATSTGQLTVADAPVASANGYSIAISTEAQTAVQVPYEEGYIKSSEVGSYNVAAATTKYVNVAKGSATISTSSISVGTGNSDYLSTAGKAVELTLKANLSKGTPTSGYMTANDISLSSEDKTHTLYIKEGSLTLSNTLSITPGAGDSLDSNAPSVNTFFKESLDAVAGKDYFKLSAATDSVFSAGYLDAAPTRANSKEYYIPRATFTYVADEGANKFIQVQTAGFIEAGAIAVIEGSIDYANVTVTTTGISAGKLTSTALGTINNGKYSISLIKGTIDAGYIGSAEGQGTLTGTLEINQAAVATTASIGEITQKAATSVEAVGDNQYRMQVVAKANVQTTITEGYVTVNDLKINDVAKDSGTNVELPQESEIILDQAVVDLEVQNVEASVAATGVTFVENSAYAVEPIISGENAAKVALTVSEAGYLGAEYTDEVNLVLDAANSTKKYIKAGTQLTSVNGEGKVAVQNNFNETVAGNYTISVKGENKIAVSGTLAEGYYKAADEVAVSGNATITGLTGDVEVAHGKVVVSAVSTSATIKAATGLVLHDSNDDNTSGYYELTPTLSGINVTKTVTEGYVKDADFSVSPANVVDTASEKYYIEKYLYDAEVTTVQDPVENKEVQAVNVGSVGVVDGADTDLFVINTDNKYVDNKVYVTLHADAKGANVRTELSKLESRLAGLIG